MMNKEILTDKIDKRINNKISGCKDEWTDKVKTNELRNEWKNEWIIARNL